MFILVHFLCKVLFIMLQLRNIAILGLKINIYYVLILLSGLNLTFNGANVCAHVRA